MQLSIVEYARHVVGYNDAHSIELDPLTTHPVIALMPDQNGIEDIGGTLTSRLLSVRTGSELPRHMSSMATEHIQERHRHRYEVNNDYRKALTENGHDTLRTLSRRPYCRND